MSELVARTGRHLQRYKDGCRLVAGCIPFKISKNSDETLDNDVVELLMINSTSGRGLLFPKGGWENDETVEEAAKREALEEAGVRGNLVHFLGDYIFKSKTLQDDFCPDGLCKAAMFALLVTEELESWPEQNTRRRSWLTVPKAKECCQYPWMQESLEGFSKWHADQILSNSKEENPLILPDSTPTPTPTPIQK